MEGEVPGEVNTSGHFWSKSLLVGCSVIVRMARVRGAHGIKAVDDSFRSRNTEAGIV